MVYKSALLVIDMQKGLLQREVFNKQDLLNNINRLLEKFHAENNPVFLFRHTNDSFSKINSDAWQLHDELLQSETDIILNKSQSSVFKHKQFKDLLDNNDINSVVIVGLVTNGCVQAACTDAKKLGFSVTLVSDAHSTFHKDAKQVISDWNTRLESEGINILSTDKFLHTN